MGSHALSVIVETFKCILTQVATYYLLEGFLTPIAEGNGIKSGLETPPTRGSFLKLTLMAEYAKSRNQRYECHLGIPRV